MTREFFLFSTVLVPFFFSASVFAQDAPPDAGADASAADVQPAAASNLEAMDTLIRGFYVEATVRGGYAVADSSLDDIDDPSFEGLTGSEGLGAGAGVGVKVGYDVSESLAIELLAGSLLVSGSQEVRVRDVGLMYGGAGGRLSVPINPRFFATFNAGVAFVSADNAVDDAENGLAIIGGAGLEYFVHVRHFSAGLDVQVFAALSPTRVFASVGPTFKYTF